MKHDVASFAIQARQLLLPLQPLSPFVFSIFDEGLLLVQLQSAQHTSIGTRVLLYSPLVGCAIGLVFTLQGIVRTCLRYATAHKLLAVRDTYIAALTACRCVYPRLHIRSMHVAVCREHHPTFTQPCIICHRNTALQLFGSQFGGRTARGSLGRSSLANSRV